MTVTRAIFVVLTCLTVLASGLAGQTPMTNDDVVTLVKAGLSEGFILNLIQQQPASFATEPGRLVELKANGVSEKLIMTMVKKNPPQEPLTSSGLMQLARANFTESFLLDLLDAQPTAIATDARNVAQLRQAGLSERVLSRIVARGSTASGVAAQNAGGVEVPAGTEITVRMIDSIDSEKSKPGDTFRASLDEPLRVGDREVAPKGADATVKLVQSKESGKLSGKTELTIELVSVTIGGRAVPFSTASVSQASASQTAKTAKTAATVGAVGAVIGAIAGGGKGAAIGAGAGAAAGAGSQVLLGGQRVLIQPETLLTFRTASAVRL